MNVTIKDIAAKLDLDFSTVSYALSGKGTIKPDTRELVRKTANEMGYVVNSFARKVKTGKSNLIGIIMPNVLLGYGEYVQHLFRLFSEAGMETSIALTEFSGQKEEAAVRKLLESCPSGLIIKTCYPTWEKVPPAHPLRIAQANRLPVVCYGHPRNDFPFSCIDDDFYTRGKILGEHFIQTGKKDIRMLVPHAPPFYKDVTETQKGLESVAVPQGGLKVTLTWLDDSSLINPVSTPKDASRRYEPQMQEMLSQGGIHAGRELMKKIAADQNGLPDAVVCLHENNCLGVYLEAVAAGIPLLETTELATIEKSIISFSLPCPVTAVYVSPKNSAEESASLLLDMIQNSSQPRLVKLKPEFVG